MLLRDVLDIMTQEFQLDEIALLKRVINWNLRQGWFD